MTIRAVTKARMLDLVAAAKTAGDESLAGVQLEPSFPARPEHQLVYLGGVRGPVKRIAMQGRYNDTFTVELWATAFIKGQSADEAEARAEAIGWAAVNAILTAGKVNGVALGGQPAGLIDVTLGEATGPDSIPDDEGFQAAMQFDLVCNATFTPTA